MPQIDLTPAKPLAMLHQPYAGFRCWHMKVHFPGLVYGSSEGRVIIERAFDAWSEAKRILEKEGFWVIEGSSENLPQQA